ncbi:MAG: hypothetical protein ACLU2X_09435 [Ruminococcus sp.]
MAFQKDAMSTQRQMHEQAQCMINIVKQRQERDNISVILIRVA